MKEVKEFYKFNKNLRFKEFTYITEHRIKCSHCDTKAFLGKADKVICPKCGYYIYKDKKEEFKNNLRKVLKK